MDRETDEMGAKFDPEGSIVETPRPRKGKGKKKKKRAGEGDAQVVREESGEQEAEDSVKEKSGGKKKVGKKKRVETIANPMESQVQEIDAAASKELEIPQKELSQETIIEVRDNKDLEDNMIVVDDPLKKDLESSGDEKKDEKKASDVDESSEKLENTDGKSEQTENVVQRKVSKKDDSAVRRRATLSELGTSVDESAEQISEAEVGICF